MCAEIDAFVRVRSRAIWRRQSRSNAEPPGFIRLFSRESNVTTTAREVNRSAEAEKLQPLEDFFSAGDARSDRWRALNVAAHDWAVNGANKAAAQQRVLALFNEMSPIEDYWAFPGPNLMRSLKEAIGAQDADVVGHLTQQIGRALLSGSYRNDASAWDPLAEQESTSAQALPP